MVGEPLLNSWITVEGGQIKAVGKSKDNLHSGIDLGSVAIIPGLVNAHTHFELSHLRDQVPQSRNFIDWVRSLVSNRNKFDDRNNLKIKQAAIQSIKEAKASGTALVGDISNTLLTAKLMHEAPLGGVVFHELLGFDRTEVKSFIREARTKIDMLSVFPDIRISLAPHAPYSVSTAMFKEIRRDLDTHPDVVTSVHLGESEEELELIAFGTGAWREELKILGVWTDSWKAVGETPVAYLANLGFLDQQVLVVHGVYFREVDLNQLAHLGVSLVTCPRSNKHVGVGSPPLESFYKAGLNVAIGTDSLASVSDLNIFSELFEARRIAPNIPARTLLQSATVNGARALGFGKDYGSIEPGKRASLITVDIPVNEGNVEEYLLSGIQPSDVNWIEAET